MSDRLFIPLPIDRDLVQPLESVGSREQLGQLASSLFRAQLQAGVGAEGALLGAIGRLKVHAHMHGLTEALLMEELVAYNLEHRE